MNSALMCLMCLVLCALANGCDRSGHAPPDNGCPNLANPSAPPTVPAQATGAPHAPPYDGSSSGFPVSQNARKWMLVVAADGLNPNPSAFQVAETRVGDVPMGPRSPWECRVDHAMVLEGAGAVTRTIACSNDGWRTYGEFTGGYCLRPECKVQGSDVDFDLRSTTALVGVTFGPRRKLDDAKYPELP